MLKVLSRSFGTFHVADKKLRMESFGAFHVQRIRSDEMMLPGHIFRCNDARTIPEVWSGSIVKRRMSNGRPGDAYKR